MLASTSTQAPRHHHLRQHSKLRALDIHLHYHAWMVAGRQMPSADLFENYVEGDGRYSLISLWSWMPKVGGAESPIPILRAWGM